MREKHKCWKLNKGERPIIGHYRFQCIEQVGRFSFEEIFNCWDCWKVVRYRIPLGFFRRRTFKNSVYWKAQKCYKGRS